MYARWFLCQYNRMKQKNKNVSKRTVPSDKKTLSTRGWVGSVSGFCQLSTFLSPAFGSSASEASGCHQGRFSLTTPMPPDILEVDHVCQMISMPRQPNETEEQKRVNENRPQ